MARRLLGLAGDVAKDGGIGEETHFVILQSGKLVI
jgi:hypothetical protein